MRFKFPVFKTNFFTQFVRFKNKARVFKCVNVVLDGKKCKKQCALCKRAYEPKS